MGKKDINEVNGKFLSFHFWLYLNIILVLFGGCHGEMLVEANSESLVNGSNTDKATFNIEWKELYGLGKLEHQ